MPRARNAEVDARAANVFDLSDRDAFSKTVQPYLRELHVHCYRMAGSVDEADDLVQETMLRAWRHRDTYQGRAQVRTWLYRIATNACLDRISARSPRGESSTSEGVPSYSCLPWMQPYPDTLLDRVPVIGPHAEAQVVARETIELAFLAIIQLLPAKQRAVLLLRDVLEFSAVETADILDDSVPAVNSALQRARGTLEKRRREFTTTVSGESASFDEAVLLQSLMDAQQSGDVDKIVGLLRSDVQMTLFPECVTWEGRDAVAAQHYKLMTQSDGQVRSIAIAANRQPAVAIYVRRSNDTVFRAWAVVVLAVLGGKFREIATFASPEMFERFNLPLMLD